VRWVREAAEYHALFLQTYRAAAERLRDLAEAERPGSWAVILDADETVLDNSIYQLRRAREGLPFSAPTWNAWVREEAAPALPGAVEFVREARALGGRVVIVTNRDEEVCAETRRNLAAVGVEADAVLCRPPGVSDKNPRYRAVREGAVPGLPPLEVLLWVGDNIHDFPGLSQPARDAAGALEPFGRTFFMLPNPMYGSWEALPVD